MTTASSPPTFLSTRRGKLTLALLCAVAFLDFVDASIVGVALPAIRRALHFTVSDLQWVPSGYLLTYGGFMLLGGRAADLIGRRRVLLAGTMTIGVASLLGGLSATSGMLIGARLAQGCGAAMMLPAALSILTTTFREGRERNTALGVWGGVGGLASAAGVLLGGLLTDGLGWRWVLFVNPVAAVLVLAAILRLIAPDGRRPRLENFDLLGALLATGGMLLLVYSLVEAPTVGWGASRTIAGLAGAALLLAAFVVNELRQRNPLAPLSIFRINGLGFADVTQLIAFAGFLAMFFFLTLYMQDVLGFSPMQTGLAYLPLCLVIGICAGIASQLIARVGTRPLIVAGALISAAGLFWLSRIPGPRLLRQQPAAGADRRVDRLRPGVRGRHHRRQRRRPGRQGRARCVAAQRLPAAGRGPGTGHPHRGGDVAHPRSAGPARRGRGRADLGLPARAVRGQPVHPGLGGDRVAGDQHPRRHPGRAGGRRR